MPSYQIKAIDAKGNQILKTIELDTEEQLLTYLDHASLDVLSIRRLPAYYRYLDLTKFTRKIRKPEVIELLENLQLIVRSGLPTNTGINDLARDTENLRIRDMLTDIGFRLSMGMSLSKAMEKYRTVFGDTVLSLITIGEETGELDNTLADAARHMKTTEDLKAKAKQALIYPTFAIVGLFSAMTFWLVYVMPNIIDAFASFDMELPATTRFIVKLSAIMQDYLFTVLTGVALCVIGIFLFRKKSIWFRLLTDRLLLMVPVFSLILKNFYMAFFAEYTRLMIGAGLPLYQALSILDKAMHNQVYKNAIAEIRESIAVGRSFSESMADTKVFPSLVTRMIGVGEQTGKMDEQLKYVSTFYYNKVELISQNIAKMIEPIIIVFIGIFMLVLMMGLLGPVYNLLSNVGTS